MVARLGEGQIGKQPGRPLCVSAPSYLCKETVKSSCAIIESKKEIKKKINFCFFSTLEFLSGPSLEENVA